MVYDAVGTKSSLPQEKEEDVKGQQKLTERGKEVVRSFPLFGPSEWGANRSRTGKMETDYETRCGVDLG